MSNMNKKDAVKQLRLSHMSYCDREIDADKAQRLTVIEYDLSKSWKWKHWQDRLDNQFSDQVDKNGRQIYSYLMRSKSGGFGLYLALENPDQPAPEIYNSDGELVRHQVVEYTPEYNPIWVRLIMRKAVAFQAHSRGSSVLGRPLLKIDEWKNEKGRGVNAIAVDCRTQQLSDKQTTEVVLFYENKPLREVSDNDMQSIMHDRGSRSLWVYDKKGKMLVRWIPKPGEKPGGSVLQEIQKNKNRRKTRPFIDLRSASGFERSWPCILKPLQEQMIEEAAQYGFYLKPKVLNLRLLPTNTKHKNSESARMSVGIDPDKCIEVLDLRYSQNVPAQDILNVMADGLEKKGYKINFSLLPPLERPLNVHQIDSLEFSRDQLLLILLDQRKGICDDNYKLTSSLRPRVASQHINVNPNDLVNSSDALENKRWLEEDGCLVPAKGFKYYGYTLASFDQTTVLKTLNMNAGIVIKELQLKHLLLCEQTKVSVVLPQQKDILTDRLVVITNGYLFTVRSDRPVLVEFNPSNPDSVVNCDQLLADFSSSVNSLLAMLYEKWPYNYRPEALMQGFGNNEEKLTRLARRLTIVLHRQGANEHGVTIMVQDPGYETPHMLPEKLDETLGRLKQQKNKRPLHKWRLDEPDIPLEVAPTFSEILPTLLRYWRRAIDELQGESKDDVFYWQIKQKLNSYYKDDNGKKLSTRIIADWDNLASQSLGLPLKDLRCWMREIPGIRKLWYDPENNYYIVGQIAPLQTKLERQPSIRQWHALQGDVDIPLLVGLIDVDWVRLNQMAGNPCVATLVKRWQEIGLRA